MSSCSDATYDKERKERQEKEYKQDYEFTKSKPARSPAHSMREHERIAENKPYYSEIKPYTSKEQALIGGHGQGFHNTGQKDGRLRMSGHSGAHRIGAKKK